MESTEIRLNAQNLTNKKRALLDNDIEINYIIEDASGHLAPLLTDMLRAYKSGGNYTDQAYALCLALERLLTLRAQDLVEPATDAEVAMAEQLTREEKEHEERGQIND